MCSGELLLGAEVRFYVKRLGIARTCIQSKKGLQKGKDHKFAADLLIGCPTEYSVSTASFSVTLSKLIPGNWYKKEISAMDAAQLRTRVASSKSTSRQARTRVQDLRLAPTTAFDPFQRFGIHVSGKRRLPILYFHHRKHASKETLRFVSRDSRV